MKVQELDTVTISIDDNRILLMKFKDRVDVEQDDGIEIIETLMEMVDDRPFYCLVDARDIFSSIDHGARKLFAQHKEYNELVIAKAYVVNNMPSKLVINFYFRFYKHKKPMKVFSDIDVAQKWLLKHEVVSV